jgi:hypothetical protein
MGEHSLRTTGPEEPEGENHMSDPTPGYAGHARTSSAKVETKVWYATAGAYLAGVAALGIVNAVTADDNALLVAALPDALEMFVLPSVPAVVSFISGWVARHTPRPDLGQA